MRWLFSYLGILAVFCFSISASDDTASQRHDSVVVTGQYAPVPLEESDRSVTSLPVSDDRLLFESFADLLQLVPSVDLQQRAPGGIQSDLTIRGSTFEQTLVLLNGIRINDVQSGHHDMDIPVPLDAVDRIEVMRGSGSTLYGSDAVGGVINIITKKPEISEISLGAGIGNFGVNQQRASITTVTDRVVEDISVSRDFSSGFEPDRDYRNLSLSSGTNLTTPVGPTDLLFAYSDKPFGADQFYGDFDSWERTKTWFGSVHQGLGEKTDLYFSYRRHTDLFVLYREDPAYYTNRHITDDYEAALRRREPLGRNTTFHYGVEGYHDSIDSNNLGQHARSRGAAYAGLDMRALHRFSLTLGAREEVYRAVSGEFSPTAAGGVWLSEHFKLRASASRAFRLPSYTDLYYQDPANMGNPNLRPERAWSYESGVSWNAGGTLKGDVAYFERLERDGIDYVRSSPTDVWRATNFDRLHFRGVEATLEARIARKHLFGVEYTHLTGMEGVLNYLQSRYVFNFPSNTALVSWTGSLGRGIEARSRLGVTQRLGQDAYAIWDVAMVASVRRFHPYLQFSNLTSTGYQEILGVPMPGRSVVGGVEFVAPLKLY